MLLKYLEVFAKLPQMQIQGPSAKNRMFKNSFLECKFPNEFEKCVLDCIFLKIPTKNKFDQFWVITFSLYPQGREQCCVLCKDPARCGSHLASSLDLDVTWTSSGLAGRHCIAVALGASVKVKVTITAQDQDYDVCTMLNLEKSLRSWELLLQ